MIEEHFGLLPATLAARIQSAVPAQVEEWALRLTEADSLAAVFGPDA